MQIKEQVLRQSQSVFFFPLCLKDLSLCLLIFYQVNVYMTSFFFLTSAMNNYSHLTCLEEVFWWNISEIFHSAQHFKTFIPLLCIFLTAGWGSSKFHR